MTASFTSVVREGGLLPLAQTIRKRLGLHLGDQIRISIKMLSRPNGKSAKARYGNLLREKDARVLTPTEQAELIALAHAEFDTAIAHAKKLAQEKHPELFDEHGQLQKRKALAVLNKRRQKNSSALKTTRRKN